MSSRLLSPDHAQLLTEWAKAPQPFYIRLEHGDVPADLRSLEALAGDVSFALAALRDLHRSAGRSNWMFACCSFAWSSCLGVLDAKEACEKLARDHFALYFYTAPTSFCTVDWECYSLPLEARPGMRALWKSYRTAEAMASGTSEFENVLYLWQDCWDLDCGSPIDRSAD